MNLRRYQAEAIDRLRGAVASGARAVCLVAPTGAGKTVMGSAVVVRAVERRRRVLWLAHRRELVDQAAATIERFGLPVGVISASSQRRPNPYVLAQVASIQTLQARDQRPDADLIVVDECHHAAANGIAEYLGGYPNATIVGLTATPERGDGRGLGFLFRELVVAATIRELTEQGALVPLSIVRPDRQLRSNQIAQRPVDAWRAHAAGRSTLVFSPSIPIAEQHAAEFPNARVIHEKTPLADRSRWLAEFKAGRLPVLVNVMTLTEGTDLPITSAIILARGCGTPGLLIQIAGRALRPHAGKTDALLIDLRGVTHVHGDPTEDRAYSLDGRGISRPGEEGDQQTYCLTCGAPKEPGAACEECGVVSEPKPLKVTGDPLVKYAAMRRKGADERAAYLERWRAEAAAKGYRPGWALAKFKAVFGEWPRKVA